MSTEFTLVRHGASELSSKGVCNGDLAVRCDLTASGVLQARALARKLEEQSFDLAVSSRFQRAQQTLTIGLGEQAVPRQIEFGLDELRFGAFEGKPIREYREWSRAHAVTDRPEGHGESRADATVRYGRVMNELLAHGCERVLVVGHGIPLTYLVQACTGQPLDLVLDPIPCATPHQVSTEELLAGLARIQAWASSAVAS